MSDEQRDWIMDRTTQASNPGHVKVSKITWLTHYPLWPFIWTTLLFLSMALAFSFHWLFDFPAVILLLMNWLYWQRVSAHFTHGDANPGLVVSTNPVLIAVTTDLSKGVGEFPVVKIFKKRMKEIGGLPVKVGTRVSTVALYSATPNEEDPHWADFDPRPVDCATSDPATIQAVMNTFAEEDWQNLKAALSQLPKPYAPGLYHLNEGR